MIKKYKFTCDFCKKETFVPEKMKERVITEEGHMCLLCKYNVNL